jgi:DNA-binding CsgD family transcriptional regulator
LTALSLASPPPDGLARRAFRHLTGDGASASPLSPEQGAIEKSELFAGAAQLLDHVAAKRAVVVAIEDLHWADPATLELFAYLTPRLAGRRILLLATFRDDELNRAHPATATIAQLMRERTVHRVVLEGLPQPDMRALIETALNGRSLSAAAVLSIARRSEGNPFFAEELLKDSLESAGTRTDPLPFSIQGAVSARLNRLSEEERDVVRMAALFGRSFEAGTLAGIAERNVGDVIPMLERAVDLQMIVESNDAIPLYSFRHALTREAVCSEMLLVKSRSLHSRIAEALEARPDAWRHVDELAYHWWEARETQKSLLYAERAGDAALELWAYRDAKLQFERALDVASDESGRVRLLEKLGDAMNFASEGDRGLHAFEIARALRIKRSEFDDATRLAVRIAAILYERGENSEAIASLAAFLDNLDEHLSPRASAEVLILQAQLSQVSFDSRVVLDLLARISTPPDELDSPMRRAYWQAKIVGEASGGDLTAWKDAIGRLRAELGGTASRLSGNALANIAFTATCLAEPGIAQQCCDEAIAVYEDCRLSALAGWTKALRARHYFLLGKLELARDDLLAALSTGDLFTTRYHLAHTGPLVGIALGDEDLILRCLDHDVELRSRQQPALYALVLASRGAVLAARGDLSGAQAILQDAVDALNGSYGSMLLLPLAARYVDEARLAKVRAIAAASARNPQDRVMIATSHMVEAIAAERHRSLETARSRALIAAQRYRELGWHLLEAHADEVAGDRAAALALYRACGSISDVRRLELGPRSGGGERVSDLLSEREREVALLVARGLTNRQAADKLCVSIKTIEKHVSSIFHKLGFRTRMELVLHIASGGDGYF